MQKIISAEEMRVIDRLTCERYSIPSLLLMEAAANRCASIISRFLSWETAGKNILILCGPGNNGGDGAALARALWTMNARPHVVLVGDLDRTRGDARVNFEIIQRLSGSGENEKPSELSFTQCTTVEEWERIASSGREYEAIVDALFGTGLTRPLSGLYPHAIAHLDRVRRSRKPGATSPLIISLDLPSGLNADSSQPIGEAVQADLTITFTAPKPANVLPPAAYFGGLLEIAAIGSPPALIEATESKLFLAEKHDITAWLRKTRYTPESYKNTHGHALVIAGSRNLTGAAVLCSDAAMCSGAGLVTLATPASALPSVGARVMPEIMTVSLPETSNGCVSEEGIEQIKTLLPRINVVAVGPGLGTGDESTRRFVERIVSERTTPVIVDADGLNALAPWPEYLRGSEENPVILTPHIGEMRRLAGLDGNGDARDRVALARQFATANRVILLLKGSRSLVAAPDGRVVINSTGNAGLGTGGAGDTLTGIVTGLNAQAFGTLQKQADAFEATLSALYIGGTAGDLAAVKKGMRAMIASDIREHLPEAITSLDFVDEKPC